MCEIGALTFAKKLSKRKDYKYPNIALNELLVCVLAVFIFKRLISHIYSYHSFRSFVVCSSTLLITLMNYFTTFKIEIRHLLKTFLNRTVSY